MFKCNAILAACAVAFCLASGWPLLALVASLAMLSNAAAHIMTAGIDDE